MHPLPSPLSQAVIAGSVLVARDVFPYIITSDREVVELASSVSVPFAAAIFFFALMIVQAQVSRVVVVMVVMVMVVVVVMVVMVIGLGDCLFFWWWSVKFWL